MTPRFIAGNSHFPEPQKRVISSRLIPPHLLQSLNISPTLEDAQGRALEKFGCREGTTDFVIELKQEVEAKDPLFL